MSTTIIVKIKRLNSASCGIVRIVLQSEENKGVEFTDDGGNAARAGGDSQTVKISVRRREIPNRNLGEQNERNDGKWLDTSGKGIHSEFRRAMFPSTALAEAACKRLRRVISLEFNLATGCCGSFMCDLHS
jgi:hypothetical protein